MCGQTRHGKGNELTFLLICDEWSPTTGGISRFNRSLATALAAAGHRVLCLVLSASQKELDDAENRGVELVTAVRTPAGPVLYVCVQVVIDAKPDVVIGHDLVSGSVAWAYARNYLKGAKFVLVVHTAHSQNEPYKRPGEATRRTERCEREIREIAAHADVIAAVGPRLVRRAQAVVGDGFGGVAVLRLDPGIDLPGGHAEPRRQVPPNATVMMLGRTSHVETKGLDIAARAIAGLAVRHGMSEPELLIRGAPADRCDTLRDELVRMSGAARDQIDVRPFTDDLDLIAHDFRRAALCVMPSRVEGFGLSALEAIGLGTPVLVSSKSGLAELLRSHLGPTAEPMIVKIHDDESDVPRWTKAIQRVLDDLPAQFDYVREVRDKLSRVLNWTATVDSLLETLAAVPERLRVARTS